MTLAPPGWARVPIERRVWHKVPAEPNAQGCREWMGKRINGYGVVNFQGKGLRAHRVVYELLRGPIPPKLFVCHTCDNRPCCAIEHLFLGTSQDNMDDMRRKGRGAIRERHGGAKLTQADADAIRTRYAAGGEGYKRLGQAYGVTWSNIRAVVTGKTWKPL